jgi:hypothetical protein
MSKIRAGFWDKTNQREVNFWKDQVSLIRRTVKPKHKSSDNAFLNLYSDPKPAVDCDPRCCGCHEDLTKVSELGLVMCFDSWERFTNIADEEPFMEMENES